MDDGSFRIRENLTFSLAEVNNIKHMFEEIAKEFNLNSYKRYNIQLNHILILIYYNHLIYLKEHLQYLQFPQV